MLISLLNTIVPTFFLIFLGWGYAKIRPDVSTRSLSDLCLYVGIPAICLRDMVGVKTGDIRVWLIISTSLLAIILPAVIGALWLKTAGINHKGLLLPIAFMNGINLPAPIINLHWGKPGIEVAVIFFLTQSVFLYIFGIALAAEKNKLKEVLKMPYIYILVLIFIFNYFNVSYPIAVSNFLDLSANMAYPLMLVVMGIILGRADSRETKSANALTLTAAFIRIGGGVAAVCSVVFLSGVSGVTKDVLLFYGVMPGAIMTTLFAEKYKRDSELVARTVFISTVVSLVLIPVMLLILG